MISQTFRQCQRQRHQRPHLSLLLQLLWLYHPHPHLHLRHRQLQEAFLVDQASQSSFKARPLTKPWQFTGLCGRIIWRGFNPHRRRNATSQRPSQGRLQRQHLTQALSG